MRSTRLDRSSHPPSLWNRVLGRVRTSLGEATMPPREVLAAGIASMDCDGHVREDAVRHLRRERDVLAGPFLALRTVDWIPVVAEAAAEVLAERMRRDPALLGATAPLLFALGGRKRRSRLEQVVLDLAADGASFRSALLACGDREVRRRALSEQALRTGATREELETLARSAGDPIVVAWAGKELVRRVAHDTTELEKLLPLLRGPAPLRCAVLDALTAHGLGQDYAARHLFDRSAAVRMAAQRLYRCTSGDPGPLYREALAHASRSSVAIHELGRAGDEVDRKAILSALSAPEASVRRAAVGALSWLSGDSLIAHVEPLLGDSSPAVAKAAARRLLRHAQELDVAHLWTLTESPLSHRRGLAYRLMRWRSPSDRLEADLAALADDDEFLGREARSDLADWLHRGSATARRGDLPTRRRMANRLALVEGVLQKAVVAEIRFHAGLRPEDLV